MTSLYILHQIVHCQIYSICAIKFNRSLHVIQLTISTSNEERIMAQLLGDYRFESLMADGLVLIIKCFVSQSPVYQ